MGAAKKSILGYGGIVAAGLLLGTGVIFQAKREFAAAWQLHLEKASSRTQEDADKVGKALGSIYENLRTLTFLPSIRKIDRHGEAIGADAKETIQQIYNNLASNVAISEVYVLPADFNPERIDPVTGKPEEPIAMFDQLIVGAGKYAAAPNPFTAKPAAPDANAPPEIEIHEYRQLKQQIDWLKQHYPTIDSIVGLKAPMISGSEVITCDNTEFIKTGNDKDRSGIIFSVPYFGEDGKLKGTVSAIILSNAVRKLLPGGSYSLASPDGVYGSNSLPSNRSNIAPGQLPFFRPNRAAAVDETIAIDTRDPRGAWTLHAVHPAAGFYASAEFRAIRAFTGMALVLIGLLTAGGLYWLFAMRRRAESMRHRATHDVLTGLPNRQLLHERIGNASAHAERGKMAALLYLDLDRFKLINDTLGHGAGDKALCLAAQRLQSCIRETDLLARIGGDEFVVLQSEVERPEQTAKLAERLIEQIARPMQIDGHEVFMGTSVGATLISGNDTDAETMLRRADLALFRAKSAERGTCRFYDPAMDAEQQKRRALEADIRQALAHNQFALHYQPFIHAGTGEITGFEALLRWKHPERGMISPAEFIPIAEDTGAINAIGEWVLRQACGDAANWPPQVRVAVNLSAVQFKNPTLPLHVVNALNAAGLAPNRLELEITESVLLASDEASLAILNQLENLGIRIALDDFGVGYSSLGYLRTFRFDKIKIDRSFVTETEAGKDQAIIKAIASLSSSLGMTTTAEGIETEKQLQQVREHGCTEIQGYYFSKPVPVSETDRLIKQFCKTAA